MNSEALKKSEALRSTGYYSLPLHTRYIVFEGKATAISSVPGKTVGSFHYPEGSDTGFQIKTRTPTNSEQWSEAKKSTPVNPSPVSGITISDWK